MRVNFCVLTNLDGEDIYVNPSMISYFQAHGPHGDKERLTRIVFDEGNVILVNGSPSNTERDLNAKENSQ